MRLGIIGLPQAGKTTIFNALTGGNQPTTMGGGRFEVRTAVVDVPDQRVDVLSGMFKPKKTTYAKITYADIAGLDGSTGQTGISGSAGIAGALLNQLTQMDAFLLVVRAFEDDSVPHPASSVDPQRDLETMLGEFAINDLIAVERKLERLADERKKGAGREKALVERETELFNLMHARLSSEETLRGIEFSPEEEKILSGFGFLSLKPLLIVVNYSESGEPPVVTPPAGVRAVPLMGKLEMDIAQLSREEAEMFLEEYGISEPSLNRMVQESYDLLGLQSFFTVGEDEVRAWTVQRGATAPEAAGTIHSDLQKGFIRAEVIGFDELVAFGGLNEAKAKGRLRVEGKEYSVQDGEIVHIRFNL